MAIELKTWKRDSRDNKTIFDIPERCSKIMDIFELMGAHMVAEGYDPSTTSGFYSYELQDTKIGETLRILKQLRESGVNLDGE